jgi:hypothetical protein
VYLNCSRCGLSLHTSRFPHIEPENRPRCLARAHVLQPLFRSPMKVRDLSARSARTRASLARAEDPPHPKTRRPEPMTTDGFIDPGALERSVEAPCDVDTRGASRVAGRGSDRGGR